MVGKKSKVGLIKSERALAKTFTSRTKGLMKKASELSKLCDIEVGVIIFGPNGDAPHVWPKEPENINRIIMRYQNKSIEERRKRAKNLSSFIKEEDQIKSTQKSVLDVDQISGFSVEQLMGLVNYIDSKIGVVSDRINMMKRRQLEFGCVKLEEVQSCAGEEQQKMIMDYSFLSLGYDSCPPVSDNQYFDHENQRDAEVNMMTSLMMMNNGDGDCYPTNVDVGDFIGAMGVQGAHAQDYLVQGMGQNIYGPTLFNTSPSTWYYDPLPQMQWQAHPQLYGDQLPFQ